MTGVEGSRISIDSYMKPPCDEAVVRTGSQVVPCRADSGPWILVATILGSSMAFIDSTVVNVALPALQSNLHATVVDVQWVVASYGLFLSALILVGGALGDSVGRRLVFLLGAGLFAFASIGCAFSSNVLQLIVARSAQGIGAAALVPGSLAIISTSFDEQSRGKAIGTWSGFTAITTALGPVIGGWLIEHASWHWIFFINVPLAAAVVLISLYHVPESRNPNPQGIDWWGAFLATVSFAGMVYGFLEATRLGWRNPLVLAALTAGVVALLLFIFVERRVAAPMIPLGLFESPAFGGANLLTLLLYAAIGGFFFFFPLNLIQIQGYSATATGAAALPVILLMFLLSRWSGGLITRYGSRTPLITGPLLAALGLFLFAVPSVKSSYWTAFFPAFVVLGLGMAVSVAPLTTVVMGSVENDRAGTASGINNAIARLAGVLAIAILGNVMVPAFRSNLERSIGSLGLPPAVMRDIQANSVNVGNLTVPVGLDVATAAAVRADIARAFVFGFRCVMLISGCLAIAAAVVALILIPSKERSA